MKRIVLFGTICLVACLFANCKNSSASGDEGNTNDKKDSLPEEIMVNRQDCFIVISKKQQHLSVYCKKGNDTCFVKEYPVCLSREKGQKTGSGDMRTPESTKGHPFFISQIQDASQWYHDFGDGRGSILSYGHWFLRLETPFSGIGIHGSTNNEESVPGRASEGCIRLRDDDIIDLKEKYAFVGMEVTIQAEDDDALPFEAKAHELSKSHTILISDEHVADETIPSAVVKEPAAKMGGKGEIGVTGGIDGEESAEVPAADNNREVVATGTAPSEIIVNGSNVNLRMEPSATGQRYTDSKGNPFYPAKGDHMKCVGQSGDFYKVMYGKKAVYISKQFCTPVK